jgi:hypothetical protein
MQHLYVLSPNLKLTSEIMHHLRDMGILKKNIHIVGGSSYLIEKAHLNEANLIQTSDLIPSIKRGALFSLVNVTILSLIYYYIIFKYQLEMSYFILGSLVTFGIISGIWGSSLIGVGLENPFVEKFKMYVKKGFYILIIDYKLDQEMQNILAVVKEHPDLKWATDEDYKDIFGPTYNDSHLF